MTVPGEQHPAPDAAAALKSAHRLAWGAQHWAGTTQEGNAVAADYRTLNAFIELAESRLLALQQQAAPLVADQHDCAEQDCQMQSFIEAAIHDPSPSWPVGLSTLAQRYRALEQQAERDATDAARWRAVRDDLAVENHEGTWRIVGNNYDYYGPPVPANIDAAADRLVSPVEEQTDG